MDACLFTVSDQPWLRGETILALVGVFLREGKGIACVEYGGKLGNPCVFSERYYGELFKALCERVPVRYRLACGTWKFSGGSEGL